MSWVDELSEWLLAVDQAMKIGAMKMGHRNR